MKGTAILFHDDLSVTFLENVDLAAWKELEKTDNTNESIENHEQLLLIEEDVDWDYGY
ncbi:hypothetical protein [Niallia sp. FSL W8-0635]|uniref:hypothetical protein n=1 Tax=Niallia sp. FSL W8-0635 TaxID=2975337 RepID=UPI0009CAA645|nr:Uncharacterised protein [Mycobacteroides abscessus subsp. abscessus]HEO8420785.1 hypothetical protein [Yersinia enterocolitica]